MSIIRCICLEIHLSVQASVYGAGVEESTIMYSTVAAPIWRYIEGPVRIQY
jgi:hypothetical protein